MKWSLCCSPSTWITKGSWTGNCFRKNLRRFCKTNGGLKKMSCRFSALMKMQRWMKKNSGNLFKEELIRYFFIGHYSDRNATHSGQHFSEELFFTLSVCLKLLQDVIRILPLKKWISYESDTVLLQQIAAAALKSMDIAKQIISTLQTGIFCIAKRFQNLCFRFTRLSLKADQ